MWFVTYEGPHPTAGAVYGGGDAVDWPSAMNMARAMVKVAAPANTYGTLNGAIEAARPGVPWFASDGTHSFRVTDTPNHTERAHSEHGASIADRWMNCPASVRLTRGMPDYETLPAKRGTAAHEVAHMCLESGQDALEFIGRTVNGIEIDEGIADGVQEYLDDCRSLDVTDKWYEVRFDLASFGAPVPMFGTADFVAYDAIEQRLYVKDYKNGFVHVGATGNPQLRYYALGAMVMLGPDKPVSDIEVTICQPNGLGLTLKRDTFDAVELIEWAAELMAAARRTLEPDAPAAAGDWCKYCKVAGSCETRAAVMLAEAQDEFGNLREVRLLTAAERGAIHAKAGAIKYWLKAVAESIAREPDGTGWKLVESTPRDAWADRDDAALSLSMEGIDPYAPREVISPAVARGRIKDSLYAERIAAGAKTTKKAAEADAREVLRPLISRISSGTVLAPDADPRPAIATGGAEFNEVDL